MIYTVGIGGMFPSFKQVTIEEVLAYCEDKKVLSVDTETEGLDFISKKMIMCQIGDRNNQFIIDTRVQDISILKGILESKSIIKIFHNFKFDDKFFRMKHIEIQNIWDTMIVEQVLRCGSNDRYRLIDVIEKYIPHMLSKIDKSTRSQFIDLGGKPYTERQIDYGAKDILVLQDIMDKQKEKVYAGNLQEITTLENKAAIAFSEIEFNGIGFDPIPWLALSNRSKEEMLKTGKELDELVTTTPSLSKFVSKEIQGDLFLGIDEIRKVNIKWTSPTQVLKVFQAYGLVIEKVGFFDLMKYLKDPFISKYLEYKKKQKLCTSYGEGFLSNVRADGRIHTGFRQILDTGRVASSGPNMQQIPGTNEYRNCFVSGYKDWVYVSSDYSSQELAVIAFGSKDPVWLKALEEKKDLHSVCAELVYGEEWINKAEVGCVYMKNQSKCNCTEHKKLRTGVKTINFGLAYGMSAFKLADTLRISKEEAQILIDKYFNAFPSIKSFLDKLGSFGVQKGYILTYAPYRRRRIFPEWKRGMDFKIKGQIERASKNTPIQGSSADMTKQAMIYIYEEIKMNSWPVKMVMTVHDQIDTICHIDRAEEWKIKMTELMEQAALIVVTNGLLKSETEITEVWSK